MGWPRAAEKGLGDRLVPVAEGTAATGAEEDVTEERDHEKAERGMRIESSGFAASWWGAIEAEHATCRRLTINTRHNRIR